MRPSRIPYAPARTAEFCRAWRYEPAHNTKGIRPRGGHFPMYPRAGRRAAHAAFLLPMAHQDTDRELRKAVKASGLAPLLPFPCCVSRQYQNFPEDTLWSGQSHVNIPLSCFPPGGGGAFHRSEGYFVKAFQARERLAFSGVTVSLQPPVTGLKAGDVVARGFWDGILRPFLALGTRPPRAGAALSAGLFAGGWRRRARGAAGRAAPDSRGAAGGGCCHRGGAVGAPARTGLGGKNFLCAGYC